MSSSDDTRSKAEIIEERRANLPLPDAPPQPSDWQSMSESINVKGADLRQDDLNIDVGSDTSGLRGPATGDSEVRTDPETFRTETAGLSDVGRKGVDGIPSDAVTSDAKEKPGVVNTEGADYGYPQKNDPSSGISK